MPTTAAAFTFSDQIKSTFPTATDARLINEIFPAAAQLREQLAGIVSPAAQLAIDNATIALLTELVKVFGALEVVAGAIETLRLAYFNAIAAGSREEFDPNFIGSVAIVHLVSVTFTAVGAASTGGAWSFGTRRFASLRSACFRAFGIDDVHATQSWTQAL
jgi:hypothetical protein